MHEIASALLRIPSLEHKTVSLYGDVEREILQCRVSLKLMNEWDCRRSSPLHITGTLKSCAYHCNSRVSNSNTTSFFLLFAIFFRAKGCYLILPQKGTGYFYFRLEQLFHLQK